MSLACPPLEPPGRPGTFAFIPRKLALEAAEVDERGLDLDHEQYVAYWVEGEQVDPAWPLRMPDLDFAPDEPAGRDQAAGDVANASGVDRIALPLATDEKWGFDAQDEPRANRCAESIRVPDGQATDPTALYQRYERLASPDAEAYRSLREANRQANGAHSMPEVAEPVLRKHPELIRPTDYLPSIARVGRVMRPRRDPTCPGPWTRSERRS